MSEAAGNVQFNVTWCFADMPNSLILGSYSFNNTANVVWVPNFHKRTSADRLPGKIGNLTIIRRPAPTVVLPFVSSSLPHMDASDGLNLYPMHRCKTIHLVRHAQGTHNVEGEKDHSAYLSPHLFDAQLTPLGWKQVDNLRRHVQCTGLDKKIELVICSPLLRTIQTAVGVFGGEDYREGIDAPPLMVENAGQSNHPAISSLNSPPFIAVELCREHLGVHWCDKRRTISEYKPIFPAFDFSLIETDDDVWWTPDIREPDEELAARGMKFLKWLWTRNEKEIAVVTHSGFLIHMLSAFGNDCHPSIKSEICRPFNNCELRSLVLVDRSMVGSDPSKTDYPGKIPSGADIPSDDTSQKHPDGILN